MAVRQVRPEEAADALQQDAEAVYLDVRTPEEFERGHPPGALNVPVFERDPGTGQPRFNEDFLDVVTAVVPADRKVLVGCASGQRSLQAAALLQQRGYTDVANVDGGFTGKTDMLGQLLEQGWQQLELPVEEGDGDERSYAALVQRASEDD